MEPIVFKHWSNKGYAIMRTFHRVVRIATLSLAYNMLQLQPVLAQADTLSPKMFFELEEVETVGEQESDLYSPLLRQLQLIRHDRLEAVSSRSVATLLGYYPGTDIRTRGVHGVQSDLSIRGGSFDQSLVLLNGIDMSNPQTGHFSLDLPLQLSQVHRLELLKGPSSNKYGLNAYSGAVNLVTRPADSLTVHAEGTYGQFNTYNAAAAIHLPAGRSRSMLAAAVGGSDGYRENTDFSTASLYLHSTLEGNFLNSDLMVGWNRKAFGANAFYTPRFPEQYEQTGSWLTALKVETQNPSFRLFGHAYWRRHRDHFMLFRSDPKVYENYHMTDVSGLAAGAKISSTAGFTTLKTELRNERIHSTALGDPLADPVKIKGEPDRFYDRFKSRNLLSLSAGHHMQLNRWHLNGGLLLHALANGSPGPGQAPGSGQPGQAGLPLGSGQALRPEQPLQAGLYPGIDLSYLLRDGLTLFASVNRSMRLPTYTDLYYEGPQNRGNPDLLPEKAVTYETGMKYNVGWLLTDLALFYRKGVETIDWIWRDSVWQTDNMTDLDTYGGEVSLNLRPALLVKSFKTISHLRIAYSYAELSKSSDTHISNYALDNLRHKVIIDLGLKVPLKDLLPRENFLHGDRFLHRESVLPGEKGIPGENVLPGKKYLSAEFFLDVKATWQQRNGGYLHYETPVSSPYETPYDPFWLIDLRAGIVLNRITLFADVTNLLNTAYRDIGSVVMPGRWFTAGIKASL
jgi:vitamin B12 transporter